MASENSKFQDNEQEFLRNFPPVATDSDIQNVYHEISISKQRAIKYFDILKEFHKKSYENHIETDGSFYTESPQSKITQLQTKEEIENFLLNDIIKNENNISIPFVNNQVSIISSSRVNNFGLRLLFSTYVKSVSFMGEFLCNPPPGPEPSTNKKCAEKAIKMLLNTSLPPLFYPILEKNPKISLDAPEIIPILPTAIATSDTTIFIGLKGPAIAMIPIQTTQDQKLEVIPIQGFTDEPFSVVYSNGFLVFSSKSIPAFHFDPATKSALPVPVLYQTNVLFIKEKMNPFEPPIVTDGSKYYSIEFGPSPKIKVFTQRDDSIIFERSFQLNEGNKPLTAPFTDLLPLNQKNIASIATNGIYISFIFRTPAASICRIFLLYNGEHLHDVPLDPTNQITAWTFDTNRPAYFVMLQDRVDMLNGCFTLPTWLTGYVLPSNEPKISTNKNQDVIDGYCNALSIVASRFIGAETWLKFHLGDQCYRTSMEKAACYFIEQKNQYAAEAFLVFIAVKMRQEESQPKELTHLLKQFKICFTLDEFSYFRKLIVYVLFSSFDSFCRADSETTGELLLKVIQSNDYKMLLFKWLPKSHLVTRVLNNESLKALCDMALKTYYVYDDLALPLLKELQYGFITDSSWNSSDLFSIYLDELSTQFLSDYQNYAKEEWSLQRLMNCVSYLVFKDLTKIVRANINNIQSTSKIADIFFTVGSLKPIPSSSIILQSLYVAFSLAFNILRKDISFISFGSRPRKENGFEEFKKAINIENPFISSSLIDSLITCAFNCCTSNISNEEIKESINIVIYKLIRKEITEEELKDKLEKVDKIQPQLFEAVFRYLKGEDIVTYSKPINSPTVWFCSTIAHKIDFQKAENRVIFAMFLPQLFELWQHLDVLPAAYINPLIEACDLRYYFPSQILLKSSIPISIEELSFPEIKAAFPTLLEISNKLNDLSNQIEEFKTYEEIDVFNEKYHNQLLDTVLKLRIAIKQKKNIKNIEDTFFKFSCQCLFMGDFVVLDHIFEIYIFLYQNEFEDTRFLNYCLKAIGEFLSLRKFLVAGKSTIFYSLQVIFATISFIRKLLMLNIECIIKTISNLIDEISDQKQESDDWSIFSKMISFFAVCNNSLEIPRPGVNACITLQNDLKYYGIITEFDGEEKFVFIDSENKQERSFTKTEAVFTEAINEIKFNPSLFSEKYEKIYVIFKNFQEEEYFQTSFFLSCLNDFMKEKVFVAFVDNSFIERILNLIHNEFITSHNSMYDLSLLFNSLFMKDPLFSLDADMVFSSRILNKLSPSAIALDNSIKQAQKMKANKQNQQNKKEKESITNIVISMQNNKKYTSTPIPTSMHSILKMETKCNSQPTDHMKLKLYLLGSYENARFTSKEISLAGKITLEITPNNRTITIKENETIHQFAIQNSCDCLFFTADLIPKTVLTYTYEVDFNIQQATQKSEGEILALSEEGFDVFSLQSSLPMTKALLFKTSSILNTKYAIETLNNFLISSFDEKMDLESKNRLQKVFPPKILAKFFLMSLQNIDKDPISKDLVLNDFPLAKFMMKIGKSFDSDLLCKEIVSYINEEAKLIDKETFLSHFNQSASIIHQKLKKINMSGYILSSDNLTKVLNQVIESDNFSIVPLDSISGSVAGFFVDIRHSLSYLANTSTTLKLFREYVSQIKEICQQNNLYNFVSDLFDILSPPIHETLTQSDEWHKKAFPSLFKENDVFTDIIDAQFFLFNGSPYCFPIYGFIPRLLCSTSFISCIVSMNQKMISFQNFPSSENEYIFLYIRCDDSKEKETVKFDISSEPGFSKITQTVFINDFAILPPYSFFVRSFSPKFDIKRAQFFWKTFSYTDSDILSLINNSCFKWKPLYSQILLSSINHEDTTKELLTQELYEMIPLSSRFSFDIVSFFAYILVNSLKSKFAYFLSEHTLNKPESMLQTPERLTRYNKYFSDFNPFQLPENVSSNVISASAAVYAFSGTIPKYTIPCYIIERITNGKNNEGALFRYICGLPQDYHLTPLLLKKAIYGMQITSQEFLAVIKWQCLDQTKEIMTEIISNLHPFVISLLFEAASSHLSISALKKSNQPEICVVDGTTEEISLSKEASTIVIPKNSEKSQILSLLMKEIMNSISST